MEHAKILGRNIRRMRKAKGYTQRQLADIVGIHPQHVYRIEKGVTGVSSDVLSAIAEALETDIATLYHDQAHGAPPLEESKKEGVIDGFIPSGKIIRIPLVAEVKAGLPREVIEEAGMFINIDADFLPNGSPTDYIAVRVLGDSMEGVGISEGDIAIIRLQPILDSGQVGAVEIQGEGSCIKRVYFSDGQIVLVSENPKYPPRVLSRDMVRIVGRVRRVIKEF